MPGGLEVMQGPPRALCRGWGLSTTLPLAVAPVVSCAEGTGRRRRGARGARGRLLLPSVMTGSLTGI